MPVPKVRRFLFLGDSLTNNAIEPGGIRWVGNQIVNVENDWPDLFIGDRNSGSWSNNSHAGFPTATIQDRIDWVTTNFTGAYAGHLLIGTNEARDGAYSGPVSAQRLYNLLDLLLTRDPTTRWAISQDIPPIDPAFSLTEATNAADLSARIPGVLSAFELARPNIYRFARWSARGATGGVWSAGDFLDPYHWNDTGNTKAGIAAKPALMQVASPGRSVAVYSMGGF